MSKTFSDKVKNIIDPKAIKELDKLKVKCKCGHSIIIPVYKDFMMCDYCGKKVMNNTILYFKYKLRKELNKNEKN